MEAWQLALIVLLALLVGALIPAIVQFQIALRKLSSAVEKIDRVAGVLDAHSGEIKTLLVAAGGMTDTIEKLKGTLGAVASVGAALGPAIGAAMSSFKSNGAAMTTTEKNESKEAVR
jgi:hypothetical protein